MLETSPGDANLGAVAAAIDASAPAIKADAGDAEGTFLQALLKHGLLVPTGVDGLYGRNATFEDIASRVDRLLDSWAAGKTVEVLRFPPAMSRKVLEESGYWRNCPDQIGTVFSFCGDDRSHQRLLKCLDQQDETPDGWTESVKPTRLTLTPAACYPVYPVMAARGKMPEGGKIVDILSYCFRHEPSVDPERMQMFRQREYIRMGTAEEVLDFRADLTEFGLGLMSKLGLSATVEVANDPFFGRSGKIMADIQRRQELKYELLVPGVNPLKPIACASFNYHMNRFGELWQILTDTGENAHTACVGFGLERITLSLLKAHGLDPVQWPAEVKAVLQM